MTLCFLQNAWSPVYAGCLWPRDSWLKALRASRSGVRLRVMLDDLYVCHNTTAAVSETPDGIEPADDGHILGIIDAHKPECVVACGLHAERAIRRLWSGKLLCVPHPAHRLLTDDLYREARRMLRHNAFRGRFALRQLNGSFERERLYG